MAETTPLSLEDIDKAADAFAELVDRGLTDVVNQVIEESGLTAEEFSELAPSDVDRITVLWEAFVAATLIPFLAQSMTNATDETIQGLVSALAFSPPGVDEPLDTQRYLQRAENRLVGIGNELWFNARSAIAAGLAAGESIPTIASRVREAASVTQPRAEVIARTESHGARNAVNYATVTRVNNAFGVSGAIRRRWQAANDSRTRDTHRRADGQVVDLSEPFQVGRASLEFPGDPSGPPEEIINCRCTTITIIDTDALSLAESTTTLTLNAAAYQEDENMPWSVTQNDDRCDTGEWAVVKDDDNELEGCHASEEEAQAQVAALNASEADEDGDGDDAPPFSGRNTIPWSGVLVVEGTPTGDGRQFAPDSLTWPEVGSTESLEISLGWLYERAHGGMSTDKVATVGRIDHIERVGNELHGRGVLNLDSQWGREAARQMGTRDNPGFLAGVSIDADDPEDPRQLDVEYVFPSDCALDANGQPELDENMELKCMMPELEIYHSGRIRAATLVDIPAYVEARLYLDEDPNLGESESVENEPLTASTYTITVPDIPPADWFNEPTEAPEIGAITVTDDGRFFGYLAPKHVAHRGYRDKRITVPMGNVDYGIWMNRATIVDDGNGNFQKLATGPITMDCGHAPSSPRVKGAARQDHYDNSCSVVATARVGENRHGVWISGALLPDISAEQVRRMMALQLSGDWGPHREKPGKRELAGALLVPVPGFPKRSYQTMNIRGGVLHHSNTPLRFGRTAGVVEPVGMRAAVDRIAESVGRDPQTRMREFASNLRTILKGE